MAAAFLVVQTLYHRGFCLLSYYGLMLIVAAMFQADEFEIFKLLNGGRDTPLQVGEMPPDLMAHFGTAATKLFLYPGVAAKLSIKHRVSSPYFAILGNALLYGHVIEDRKSLHIGIIHNDTVRHNRKFFLVIKANRMLTEFLLVTFFRVDEQEARRKTKKANTIRPG